MRRTERADIFDNFTPSQAAEVAALIASMPGCKLTVRRSRRRPIKGAWLPFGNELSPTDSFMNYLSTRDIFWSEPREDNEYIDKLLQIGGGWWQSPAQRGRIMGRLLKGAGWRHWAGSIVLTKPGFSASLKLP